MPGLMILLHAGINKVQMKTGVLYSTIELKTTLWFKGPKETPNGSKAINCSFITSGHVSFQARAEEVGCFGCSRAERLVMKPIGTLRTECWMRFLHL